MPAKKRATQPSSFTDEERAAMRDRARETEAEARWQKSKEAGESACRAAIAEMPEADRALAERLFDLIQNHAPVLMPRTWYGMPAWANVEGKVVCFFQGTAKFQTRYATFGFTDAANLDNGAMWPTAFAVREITPEVEERIVALIRRAVLKVEE
jgi:hypothetical protein